MTRLKKRRSGKHRTEDQKKSVAGRRRAKKAEKPAAVDAQPIAKDKLSPEQKAAYKKSLQPVQSSRRNRSAATKMVKNDRAEKENRKTPVSPVKATGKTRSAGSRRVAVSKAIAHTYKKNKGGGKNEPKPVASKKAGKGFAPWNKNKFKKKGIKGEE